MCVRRLKIVWCVQIVSVVDCTVCMCMWTEMCFVLCVSDEV